MAFFVIIGRKTLLKQPAVLQINTLPGNRMRNQTFVANKGNATVIVLFFVLTKQMKLSILELNFKTFSYCFAKRKCDVYKIYLAGIPFAFTYIQVCITYTDCDIFIFLVSKMVKNKNIKINRSNLNKEQNLVLIFEFFFF